MVIRACWVSTRIISFASSAYNIFLISSNWISLYINKSIFIHGWVMIATFYKERKKKKKHETRSINKIYAIIKNNSRVGEGFDLGGVPSLVLLRSSFEHVRRIPCRHFQPWQMMGSSRRRSAVDLRTQQRMTSHGRRLYRAFIEVPLGQVTGSRRRS